LATGFSAALSCGLTFHRPAGDNRRMQTSRRSFLTILGTLAAAPLLAREFGKNAAPVRYPEPDVIALENSFKKIKIGNASIERLHTGMRWAEGPAWSGQGQYLMWSDIPNDVQMRYLPDDGHVSVLRKPAQFSNGNTFDREGRQLSCEHGTRRVVRYEANGEVTVLAEKFDGKPFNAPNDIVVTPDGAIWFTDPGYGALFEYEGKKQPLEQKEAVYRIDPATAKVEKVTDEIFKPNGLCFSPDYKKLYIADTGSSHYKEAPKNIKVWDVDGAKLKNGQEYCSMVMDAGRVNEFAGKLGQKLDPSQITRRYPAGVELKPGVLKPGVTVLSRDIWEYVAGMADGIRCDTEGNVWVGAGWVGPGYDGVHVFSPEGKRIGLILLPEICANVCFGGPRRNRLFMTASQSLYAVYVEAKGAHFC
jgi:gluconolactonase